jgi:hypothetical protein
VIARRAGEAEIARKGLDPGEFEIITASQLVVYAIGERELDPVLAWRVKTYLQYGTLLDTDYFIDQGGRIITEISNIYTEAVDAQGIDVLGARQDFTVDRRSDGGYDMRDPTRKTIRALDYAPRS